MAIRDKSVRYFDSTQSGAPALSGTADTLIAVLDACLVSGFGAVTASSLVVADGIATLTVSGGHGFTDPGAPYSIDVGAVVVVSGVTGALTDLNTTWRATVTSATVLTWDCGEIADGTASGTISLKRAPAGWTKQFSGTNKAAYARGVEATAMLLRIDDSGTTSATAVMYESMTDIDSGTAPTPAAASIYAYKSATANTTARPWCVFCNDRMVYVFINANGNWEGGLAFGDIISYMLNDAYCCYIAGGDSSAPATAFANFAVTGSANNYLARNYSGHILAPLAKKNSFGQQRWIGDTAYAMQSAVNAIDDRIHLSSIAVQENESNLLRGKLPGVFSLLNAVPHGTLWFSDQGMPICAQQIGDNTKRCAILLEESWYA